MIIYKASKADFLEDVGNHLIADILENSIQQNLGRTTSPSEKNSWSCSLMEMKNVLEDHDIPQDCGVGVEYNIPLSGKRVDVILSGYDSNGRAYMVVIELKQWQSVEAVPGSDGVVKTFINRRISEKTHPSYQAWSYAVMLSSYNEFVQRKPVNLSPCAYLHNYAKATKGDPLFSSQYRECLNAAPIFTRSDVANLRQFIKKYILRGDRNCSLIVDVDGGKIKPAKSLQDSIAGMMKGNPEFNLIESQKVAHDRIVIEARCAQRDAKKHIVIVKGGPGTGKSVIAIAVMAKLTQAPDSQFVQYVSKNSAPRNVYKVMLKGTKKHKDIDLMFQGPDSFYLRPENMMATVLVDEAHRLRMRSGQFCNKGESQIREIIKAAKCSVFFVDDHQRVTVKDCCTVDAIIQEAHRFGVEPVELELDSQFRCNGSDGYVGWIDNVLGVRNTVNTSLVGVNYDFKVFDDPEEMYEAIKAKNANNKARVVAGYCWEWNAQKKNDPSYKDIHIGTFGMSWNLGNTETWAIDSQSVCQAGCIHTCQGLEFEYVGVIIGNDLRYEEGGVVTDWRKRAKTDSSIKGAKGVLGLSSLAKTDRIRADEIGKEIILNTYRTLMTRGMKGCYVYCCDQALAQYLKMMKGAEVVTENRRDVIDAPRILRDDEFDNNLIFVDFLPVYALAAACSNFGASEVVDKAAPLGWMNVSKLGLGKLTRNLYIVRAQGDSMDQKISEGQYCVMEYCNGACHENDIVLAELSKFSDLELPEGSYVIKQFTTGSDDENRVVLKPLSNNPVHKPIVIQCADENANDLRVVGVLRKRI